MRWPLIVPYQKGYLDSLEVGQVKHKNKLRNL